MKNLVVCDWFLVAFYTQKKPIRVTNLGSSILTVSVQKIDYLLLLLCWNNWLCQKSIQHEEF